MCMYGSLNAHMCTACLHISTYLCMGAWGPDDGWIPPPTWVTGVCEPKWIPKVKLQFSARATSSFTLWKEVSQAKLSQGEQHSRDGQVGRGGFVSSVLRILKKFLIFLYSLCVWVHTWRSEDVFAGGNSPLFLAHGSQGLDSHHLGLKARALTFWAIRPAL